MSTITMTSPPAARLFPFYSPIHVSRVRRGVWACCLQPNMTQRAWELFKAWKDEPSLHPDVTAHLADELVRLIRECLPVIPADWLITVPPQGKSAAAGGEYAAGFLGRAVSERLNREFVTCFAAQTSKKYHGRFESIRRQEPFVLAYIPDVPVILVDDLITSGRTMKTALDTLSQAGVVNFGFAYATTG